LSWIVHARRRLSTEELQHALAVEEGESEIDEDAIPDKEDILSVCAGLVVVDEESNTIRLVHYTTQEYFNANKTELFPDAEDEITQTCVSYLLFGAFTAGYCKSYEYFRRRIREHVFYEYAAL